MSYAESANFLLSEKCYLVQFCVSVRLTNVGGLCSVVLIIGTLKVDFLHTENVADFPFPPNFWKLHDFLLPMRRKPVTQNIFWLQIHLDKKKCCHSVSSSPS